MASNQKGAKVAATDSDLRAVGSGARGYRPLTDPARQESSTIRVAPEIDMERTPSSAPEVIDADLGNKPENRPYYQQTLRSWSPLLTPWRAVGGYLLIGLIFVPLGAVLWEDSDVVELRLVLCAKSRSAVGTAAFAVSRWFASNNCRNYLPYPGSRPSSHA